ncbi:PREDICTED: uncharacterized protein LOC104737884 [Camelina sativa]|uniref:Uncharacterized protein LOC104737884 n=1 Tax=Camelina sativa TaxID=90675 RepID=A0ABM1QV18_CAMSA|nr:PREDICTED: uncharacterized protein LOC104737884 [Camelina sativa]
MDLVKATGTIGASHGWVATLRDGVVRLQDDLNPIASDSDPKRISLPPLVTLPHCQTQFVTNVAMSSSSPEDDDCIVAVKFLGPQLSLCRPARKDSSEWVNIRIEEPEFFSSRVMYSRRDKMFSMLGSGGAHTGSWDLGQHMHKPKILSLSFFTTLPEFFQSELQILDSCCTTEHLVESRPTGEMFMVKTFIERNMEMERRMETRHTMVFKLNEMGKATYTEDIGDLCIFLSKSEAFCLKASSSGHCRNTIYYIENNERGTFNLKNKEKDRIFITYPAPYYIPPQSSSY